MKVSSLVSLISFVVLYYEKWFFEAYIGRWVLPGVLCAVMYLELSLRLASFAQGGEEPDILRGSLSPGPAPLLSRSLPVTSGGSLGSGNADGVGSEAGHGNGNAIGGDPRHRT